MMKDPYIEVTERPGLRATPEQLSMLYTRYHTAASYAEGKKVLEVACGAGMGLGYMARRANRVVGGDYSESLLLVCKHHYEGHIPLVRLDAQTLPFKDASFDLVVFYEALYYLARPENFVAEVRRVLRLGGTLLICTANKDRSGFVRSPHSYRYFSARELCQLLEEQGSTVKLFGAFPVAEGSLRGSLMSLVRRVIVSLNLVPGTLKGRELLKRLAYGKLQELKPEVSEGMAELESLVPISGTEPTRQFKVLYALAHLS